MDAATVDNMANAVRAAYRAAFTQAVAAGRARPMVMPYSLLGAFILPTIWLAIPHTRRPWLYRSRWLVMLFIVVFNLRLVRDTSSTNMAGSYGAGLVLAWGIVSNANLLLWKRPQFDSARVIRRPWSQAKAANGTATQGRANGVVVENGIAHRRPGKVGQTAAEEHVDDDSEFVWETFPEDAPFSHRLNWALDLVFSLRGAGWSHSISSIPRPEIPTQISPGAPVKFDSMLQVTGSGYKRHLNEKQLVRARLRTAFICYVILDFLAVFMMKDPYFIFGPDHPYPLPAHLQGIPSRLLIIYRQVFSLAGVICAIAGLFGLSDLAQYYLAPYTFPRVSELWLYASTNGSFLTVLDRGIAGWWGGWWHQTFRMQFQAPSLFLLKHGYVDRDSLPGVLVSLLMAFSQSGLLHALGSATSIPPTKVWRAPVFFLLQGVGIMVQTTLCQAVGRHLPRLPRTLSRIGNLVFTLAWLHLTADFFLDDLASAGLWLFEPVPISLLRWLGFGHQGDHWWRWDREHFPKWHSGQPWWQGGIAI